MAASYYFSATSGTSLTFPSSTPANTRCGIIIAQAYSLSFGSRTLTSLTWGGLQLVGSGRLIANTVLSAADYIYQDIYLVSEADIAAYNGNTVTATWSDTLSDTRISVVGFQDALDFTYDSLTGVTLVSNASAQSLSGSVTVPTGGVLLASVGTGYNGSQPNNLTFTNATERSDITAGAVWRRAIATADAVSGSVSVTADWTGTAYTTYGTMFLVALGPSNSVAISGISDSTPNDGQTGVTITGTGFGATQGAGKVYISPTNDVDDAGRIEQTVTSWADTSIEFTAVKGTLSFDTNAYLFVVTDGGQSNASGSVVQISAIRYLKVLVDSAAVAATNISGVVFAAPSGSDITGAKIGEFTGESVEAALESGQAVLKVLVTDFGGESLTTSDTPVVLFRNTDYTTGLIQATVINE